MAAKPRQSTFGRKSNPKNQAEDKSNHSIIRSTRAELPLSTQQYDDSNVNVTEVNSADFLPCFAIPIREVVTFQTFSPSTPAAIEISRYVYSKLWIDSPSLLPEYLDYYMTACIWIRIISLKQKNSQPTTEYENQLLNMIDQIAFCIPEPMLLQIIQLGNITATGTNQHLYPEFPPLPNQIINNLGGFYGELENNNDYHNLYEEIPCLGVLAEAVMNTITNVPAGNYKSRVLFHELQPNRNLLGFKPLGFRKDEAKNIAFNANIYEHVFPENPPHTAFNIEFLMSISSILSRTSTFKKTSVKISTLSVSGAQSQAIISRPVTGQQTINIHGEIEATSLSLQSLSSYSESIFYLSQLIKTPGHGNNHSMWCVFTPTEEVPIPKAWIQNRNARRNLPTVYNEQVFKSTSIHAEHYRTNVIQTLSRYN